MKTRTLEQQAHMTQIKILCDSLNRMMDDQLLREAVSCSLNWEYMAMRINDFHAMNQNYEAITIFISDLDDKPRNWQSIEVRGKGLVIFGSPKPEFRWFDQSLIGINNFTSLKKHL